MAHGRGRYGLDPRIACVSPLWKHSSGSVVSLKMRPPAPPFTSLDTFMAAHSPRRFCQTRQKYLLKPLTFDKRIGEAGFAPVPDDIRKSRAHENTSGNCNPNTYNNSNRNQTSSPSTSNSAHDSSSSDQEQGCHRVLPLGKCKLSNEEDLENHCETPHGQYKTGSFKPSPRLPFTFNRSASIPSTPRDASDLIAIGTISMTSQRQPAPKPMSSGQRTSRQLSEDVILNVTQTPKKRKNKISTVKKSDVELNVSPCDEFEEDHITDHEPQEQHKNKTTQIWKTKATLNLRGCKYPDPMPGAGPGFQARIAEMAQLEVDTIKYEKSRKIKKKSPT